MKRATVIEKETGRSVELQFSHQDQNTVTFRRPGGRFATLSRRTFEDRFELPGAARRAPAAASSPAPASSDPEAPAMSRILGGIDEVREELAEIAAKVSALYRFVTEARRFEDPPPPPASPTS